MAEFADTLQIQRSIKKACFLRHLKRKSHHTASIMVHTVGIAGVNGNVGAPTVKLLATAAAEGKIKLVVFHRDGSTAKDVSQGKNVEFRILNYEDPPEKIESAVAGINVFMRVSLPVERITQRADTIPALRWRSRASQANLVSWKL